MNFDGMVLIACLAVVVGVACVVNRLRRGQRLVVLAGIAAMGVQVFCPPCDLPDGSTARRWMSDDIAYRESSTTRVTRVDVGRQTLCLTATIAATAAGCVVLEWRHRRGRPESATQS